MSYLPPPPFEVRLRFQAAAFVNRLIQIIWSITGKPLEKLSLWLTPNAIHCPVCWRYQKPTRDGGLIVNHKKNCDYVRLMKNEKAWAGYPPAV